jgi:O-antigen/teichoic acid export membrane protein
MHISTFKANIALYIKVYSFSIVSLLGFGVTFLQSFLFAAILSKEEFGKLLIVSTLFSVFSYLSVFGLDTALFKFYHDDKVEKQVLNWHIFLSWIILSLGLFVFLTLLGAVLILYFDFKLIDFSPEYLLLLISGIIFSFFLVFQQYFIASKQILFYAIFTIGVKAVILAFNLLSIYLYGSSIFYFVLSYFLTTSFLFLATIGIFQKSNRGVFQKDFIKDLLLFSWPLSVNSLISSAFTNGYRILISSLMTLDHFATFGIISQIASAYYIGISAVVLPHNSEAYKELNKLGGKSKSVSSYFNKCVLVGVIGFVAIILVSIFVLKYLKNGIYFEGIKMLPILLLGQFFFILYSHEYIVLSYFRLTSRITFSTLSGIVLILTLFYPLINSLGVLGACIVVLIGYIAQYFIASMFRRAILIHK